MQGQMFPDKSISVVWRYTSRHFTPFCPAKKNTSKFKLMFLVLENYIYARVRFLVLFEQNAVNSLTQNLHVFRGGVPLKVGLI